MNIIYAIILGLVQGLTEFIPISSTAHLTLAAKALNLIDPANPEKWTAFMAVMQLGTLAAVFVYFAQDISTIAKTFIQENVLQRIPFAQQSVHAKMGWNVVIGSIPIGVLGLALKKLIEGEATKTIPVIASALIGLAVLLFIAERMATLRRGLTELTWKDALIVGATQALALIPGSSRSGTTITAGLFLGMTRETAARFSFLLSIPAISASGLLEFVQHIKYLNANEITALLVSTLVAGISGYLSIAFLLKFLRTNNTTIFIIYRIALGVALLLWFR